MLFDAQSTGETLYGVYEGVTISSTGTVITPINNNRHSSNVSSLLVGRNGTLSASGTNIYPSLFGVTGNPVRSLGGALRADSEIILKKNTAYAFIFRSTDASNNLDYRGYWYEHTPKGA